MTATKNCCLWLRKLAVLLLLMSAMPVVAHTVTGTTGSSFFHNIGHTVEFLSIFVLALLALYGTWKLLRKPLSQRLKKRS